MPGVWCVTWSHGPKTDAERKRTAGEALSGQTDLYLAIQAGQSRSFIQRNVKKCGPSWELSGFLKMLINCSRKKGKTIQGKVCKLPE